MASGEVASYDKRRLISPSLSPVPPRSLFHLMIVLALIRASDEGRGGRKVTAACNYNRASGKHDSDVIYSAVTS